MIEINAGFRHHFLAIAQAQLQTRYYRTHSGPKGVTVPDALCCTRNYDTSNFCHSSPNSLLAQWRWKRVPAVIIGAVGGASIPSQPSSVPLIPNFHTTSFRRHHRLILVIACFAWKLVELGSVDKEGCLLERPNPCGRHGGYQAGLLHRQ